MTPKLTRHSVLLERTAPALYWIMLAAAIWILLRGHNEPGGGFVGGLLAVAASAQLAIVAGVAAACRRQPLPPLPLAMAGVALALYSGLFGVVSGLPFLTHLWGGRVSTVMLFDLGVFCAVWGALTGYLFALLEVEAAEETP